MTLFEDWGQASEPYDEIRKFIANRDISKESEAQTRYDVIDRIIREVLGWGHGHVGVEVRPDGDGVDRYVDYVLRQGDTLIVVEAKKAGAAFPLATKKKRLKIDGSVLGRGDVGKAIDQALSYAIDKDADAVVVTNGVAWIGFPTSERLNKGFANLYFPLQDEEAAERLFNDLARPRVEINGIFSIANSEELIENRLLSVISDAEDRLERNGLADHISPALDDAMYSESIIGSAEKLKNCFVFTDNRVKYDSVLGVSLGDAKSSALGGARRIRKSSGKDEISEVIEVSHSPAYAPPVTLVIGSVGSGKSTYLKHYELVGGADLLERKKAHWIYVDFELLGDDGNPRDFMYASLLEYINDTETIDYNMVLRRAYDREIAALARGPLQGMYRSDKEEFEKQVSIMMMDDLRKIEPYVDKVISHIALEGLCIIVLDNIDLSEDESLELSVLSEGLAFSRRSKCHVMVSIRDDTFVRHKDKSSLNAYEFKKMWLDPPPIRDVLKKRLNYASKVVKNKKASITIESATFIIPDLGVFFEMVQSGVLDGRAGEFIEYISGNNVRYGLDIVKNFLVSGHTSAEKSIRNYIAREWEGFPFGEIFRGSMLGQWKYYSERRSECVNIFESHLHARMLKLLRYHCLKVLGERAKLKETANTSVLDMIKLFSRGGCSEDQLILTLEHLRGRGLIRSTDTRPVQNKSIVAITRSGAYYINMLCASLDYAESCMYDTVIEDGDTWNVLSELTRDMGRGNISNYQKRLKRHERIKKFMKYIESVDIDFVRAVDSPALSASMVDVRRSVTRESWLPLSR